MAWLPRAVVDVVAAVRPIVPSITRATTRCTAGTVAAASALSCAARTLRAVVPAGASVAVLSCEAHSTTAGVAIHMVYTCGAIETPVVGAVVNVGGAVAALVARCAGATVSVHIVGA